MTKRAQRPDLKAVPLLKNESLYVGVDIAKSKHVAGFVSKTLLERLGRFEACPAHVFENSREGFRSFIMRIQEFAPLEHVYIVMERTGHYHRPLEQYLHELDVCVYLMHVQSRPAGMLKTDKRDALNLANHLYSQLELGVQVPDKLQLVRRVAPPTPAAAQLRGLIRHRYELVRETTRRKNKLTAICDQLFPELVQVIKDPNGRVALVLREHFPTPHALATASFSALCQLRGDARYFSDAKLVELQRLAEQSIGVKDLGRQPGQTHEKLRTIGRQVTVWSL